MTCILIYVACHRKYSQSKHRKALYTRPYHNFSIVRCAYVVLIVFSRRIYHGMLWKGSCVSRRNSSDSWDNPWYTSLENTKYIFITIKEDLYPFFKYSKNKNTYEMTSLSGLISIVSLLLYLTPSDLRRYEIIVTSCVKNSHSMIDRQLTRIPVYELYTSPNSQT